MTAPVSFLGYRIPPVVAWLVGATFAVSLVAALDHWIARDLALVPARVWRGEVWRLVTWTFVQVSPLRLILTCAAIFWFGRDLESVWGSRRFLAFVAALVLAASVGTTVLALVVPRAARAYHYAGWALQDALVIAWALRFPLGRVRIYYVLVLGGPALVYAVLAFTMLCVVFFGAAYFLPEVIAAGLSIAIVSGAGPRWWRELRARFARFGVVPGGRHGGPYHN